MYRHIWGGVLSIIFFLSPVYAQTGECDRNFLQERAPRTVVKTDVPVFFTLPNIASGASVTTRIMQGPNQIFSSNEMSFSHAFVQSGDYQIITQYTLSDACATGITNQISAFDKLITYLGAPLEDVQLLQGELAKQGIGIQQRSPTTESRQTVFALEPYLILESDAILINLTNIGAVLDGLSTSLQGKKIYTTSPLSQSTFRRIAARYQHTLGVTEISVIKPSQLNLLLSAMAFGKDISSIDLVRTFSVTANDHVRETPVSYAIDYLLYTGFPLSLLTWMLVIPALAVLLALLRQVVGMSVFGIFNPLMLGLSFHIAGISPTLIMLGCGVCAVLLVRAFTKSIFLLYSAKVALTLTLYILGVVFAFALSAYFNGAGEASFTQWEMFASSSGLFCLLFQLVVARHVFSPKTSFSDIGRWLGVFEFMLISLAIYRLLANTWLQNLLLGYPEITFLFVLLSILIGRFSGLQLIEYIRFMPVIKFHMTKK